MHYLWTERCIIVHLILFQYYKALVIIIIIIIILSTSFDNDYFPTHLAAASNANSTFNPDFALVSINGT